MSENFLTKCELDESCFLLSPNWDSVKGMLFALYTHTILQVNNSMCYRVNSKLAAEINLAWEFILHSRVWISINKSRSSYKDEYCFSGHSKSCFNALNLCWCSSFHPGKWTLNKEIKGDKKFCYFSESEGLTMEIEGMVFRSMDFRQHSCEILNLCSFLNQRKYGLIQ